MKLNLDCIPCFQRQALQAVRFLSNDEELQQKVLRTVIETLLESNWESTPPALAHKVHHIVKNITNTIDPYMSVKKESNDLVLKLYPELEEIVNQNCDPLRTAIKLAIAGNIIDFGAVQEFDLEQTIKKVLEKKFAIDDFEQLEEVLKNASSLLFFVDNAGEIGLDKLLLETILKKRKLRKITIVVKGGPIINDATLKDVYYIGLEKIPNVEFQTLTNGELGTGPERNSQTVKQWIKNHTVVISKGQGNYEGLSEHKGVFFLLIAKCPVIASDLGVKKFDIVLKHQT